MTEASRVQKMLNEHNAEIDRLKNRIEKLVAGEIEFDRIIGDYASENARFRDRIEKLTAALRDVMEMAEVHEIPFRDRVMYVSDIARKAQERTGD